MKEWMQTLRGVVLFDGAAYARLRERGDLFFLGFLLVFLLGLISGLPDLGIAIVRGLSTDAVVEAADVTAEIEQGLAQVEPLLQSLPSDVRDQILLQARQGFELAAQIGGQVAQLPTIFPRRLALLLEAVGRWASRPLAGARFPLATASLGTWLGYGIWVMLMARLLGGRASLATFFGMTSLFAVPHLLQILARVPYVGSVFSFIAFLWGVGIYVKATAVSHELGTGRAVLAALLPLLVVAFLAAVIAIGIAGTVVLILLTR